MPPVGRCRPIAGCAAPAGLRYDRPMNVATVLVLGAAALLAGCERMGALASGTPWESYAKRCEALPPGRIDVVHVRHPVAEDFSLANADLERLAEPAMAHHRTVGLTRAQFGYRTTLELDGLEDPRGSRSCARPRIRIEVASSSMTVYIAREYHGDACREPLILEHERRHVEVFERYGDEAARALARELDAAIGTGVRHAPSLAGMQADLTAELASRLEAFMTRARAELSERHAAVDTDREYDKLARRCGATADLAR